VQPGGTNSIGLMIKNYGVYLTTSTGYDFTWLYLLIAILIICIFIFVPFGLAHKYDFSFPNFLYAIFIIAGGVTDQALGLLDLWMTAMIIAVVVLAVIVRYKDELDDVVHFDFSGGNSPVKTKNYKHKKMFGKVRKEE
jgi:hypothetical protein